MRLILILAMVATIGCDQATKHAASRALAGKPGWSLLGDTVRIAYAENTGAFLSLGAGLPDRARFALFTIGTALLILLLAVAAVRFRWSAWPLLGTSLLVAGGASNLMDRVARGHVIDFMNVGIGPIRTGIFNVADVAIVIGTGLLVLAMSRSGMKPPSSSDVES